MALLNGQDLISIISNALSLSQDDVDENSGTDNLVEWDSLGHLSVLSALDQKTNGKSSDIEGISELDSFKKLKVKLVSEGLMDES